MPLKAFVKVGSITNLSDARYCAGMTVDLLGFRAVEGQENYIKSSLFQEIRGWISGPLVVAEVYGLTHSDQLAPILENYKPDYLEMGVKELRLFNNLPLPLILAIGEGEANKTFSVEPAYLLSASPLKTSTPLLVNVQSKDELDSLLADPNVKGIVLKGGNEVRPGLKEFELMNDVLEALEVDA